MQFKFSTQTLYTEEMAPDVLCIQETWLRKDTKFEIEGYTIIEDISRTDRKRGGAIFIDENISYERTLNIPHETEGVPFEIRTRLNKKSTSQQSTFNQRNTLISELSNQYLPPKSSPPRVALYAATRMPRNTLWGAAKNDHRGKQLD